jgi:hypothetical protein
MPGIAIPLYFATTVFPLQNMALIGKAKGKPNAVGEKENNN